MSNSKEVQKKKKDDEKSAKSKKSVSVQRSPPQITKNQHIQEERSLDVTQELSAPLIESPNFKIDKEKTTGSQRIVLSGYSSRRVQYKKNDPGDGAVDIDADLVKNDKTLRDKDWFMEKIERCKHKKLQRTCVCPLPPCVSVVDAIDGFKGTWQRVKRVCFLACCPPFCCIIQRSAFWPPRREYYFFKPPPDDVLIKVINESDAVLMKARKKKLKKLKRAKKCVPGERYSFGMSHPCADDVKYVEGFAVKTAKKNTIGCVYIPCPDGRSPRFTLLYSHPNGSDISDHLVGVPSLVDLARFYRCDLYSYDYSGYGISGGVASEKNLYADIRAVYEYITIEKHVDPKRLVLLGYSIGSAATIELLRHEKDRKPAGVILQAPPTSILRVIGNMMGRKKHLDKPTCCMDRFVSLDKIHEIEIPILIIHGKDDHTVPIEHGQLLCERAVSKVVPEWVPEASHDNIENCRVVWKRIRKFVKEELNLK